MERSDWDEWDPSRREQRNERRRLQRADRSYRKLTDQRKALDKQSLLHGERARVLRVDSEGALLLPADGIQRRGLLGGQLKYRCKGQRDILASGDWVRVKFEGTDQALIVAVEERSTELIRAEHLKQRSYQVLAANIDLMVLVMSVGIPAIRPNLIDRMLIMAQRGGLRPIICFNKLDLAPSYPQQAQLLHELKNIYQEQQIPVVCTSVEDEAGYEQLKQLLAGQSTVFAGQSGVGKSSLVERLTGKLRRTAPVIVSTRKGAHMTSQAELIPLMGNGWVVDTPGIRSFGIWDVPQQELQHYFPDIAAIATDCRFENCSHNHEPGCAVKAAIQAGTLAARRLDSLLQLREGWGVRDQLDWLDS